jgi:hypothetical protein
MSDVNNTLAERGARYGDFKDQGRITQNLKKAMRDGTNFDDLSDDMKEALDMIASKISRILNGDPNYADSWHDICGYSKLIEDRLNNPCKHNGVLAYDTINKKYLCGECGAEIHDTMSFRCYCANCPCGLGGTFS